jgi:hypothetical protein
MSTFTRLYLVPINGVQQVIDVNNDDLVLSNGEFRPPQVAPSVTLIGATYSAQFTPFGYAPMPTQTITQTYQEEIRVCWREPVGEDDYPNENVIVAYDPTNGQCVCGVTCSGPDLSYVVVKNVTTQ